MEKRKERKERGEEMKDFIKMVNGWWRATEEKIKKYASVEK